MPFFRPLISLVLRQPNQLKRRTLFGSRPVFVEACKMAPKLAENVARSFNVTKSESDKNCYIGLELRNGIKVLVVSDPTTDKAAVALNVQVGSLTDPREIPGLAHFCEHMLFLGTKKYPSENHYNALLSSHGGMSNAYTALDHTCYFFDVTPEHLKEVADVFAQFFHEPLFDQSCTDRELQAVHSEHEKNIKQDMWRLWHLEGVTGNPEHDFSKFGTGNRDTLDKLPKENGLDVRQALLDFHSKYYSSDLMSVCILGKESLDDLSDLAIGLFAGVAKKNVVAPYWPDHPFRAEETRLQTKIVPVKDLKQMVMTFPVPDSRNDYRTNQGHYISHLVGHEGQGSLLSFLKEKGWVNSLSGGIRLGGRGFSFFTISMRLTPEGITNSDNIATAVFQYLDMLRKAGPQDWIFEELKNLGAMHFRFKSKEIPTEYVTSIAESIHNYEWEDVLSGAHLVSDYKPELITELMEYLVPEKVRIALVSNTFEGQTNQTEPYYGTEYACERIPDAKIHDWENVTQNDSFALPQPNEFICTNFEIAPEEKGFTAEPQLLINEPSNRIWYMQDRVYMLPGNVICFDLRSPLAYKDPLSACLTNVAVTCFNDANNEYFYSATLAGLSYNLENRTDGLMLKIRGYNERQHAMLEKLVERLVNFKIDSKRFSILKESCIRRMRNFAAEQPYQHALYYTNNVLTEKFWTYEQILEVVENGCTMEACQNHLTDVLRKLHVEAFIHGNTTKEEAHRIGETVKRIIQYEPLSSEETKGLNEFKLNDGEVYQLDKVNEVHPTNAIMSFYQVGAIQENNMRGVALNDLLCQVLDQPCFNSLRTKEQLGYIVSSGSRKSHRTYGFRILIQSERHPTFLTERIDNFLNVTFKELLCVMSDEEFENHKSALIALKLERPKKLHDKFTLLMREISTREYVFNREQLEADEVRKLTKADLMDFFERFIGRGAPELKQLIVNVESKVKPGERVECVKAHHNIVDLQKFKSTHTLLESKVDRPKL